MKSDKEYLRTDQYRTSEGYLTRVNILDYGDNKEDMWHWVAKHYDIVKAEKILEVGCGTGDLWQYLKEQLHPKQKILLTDFSPGMLEIAKAHVKNFNLPVTVNFEIADAENLPYQNQSFDIVFANLMLYHVTSQPKALAEIKRVLKLTGWAGISTFALENFGEILQLAHKIDTRVPPYTVTYTFPEERADYLLKEYFSNIKKYRYFSQLKITNLEALMNLVRNYTTIKPLHLPESFFQQYAAEAQKIIKNQGTFASKFNMVLYICSLE